MLRTLYILIICSFTIICHATLYQVGPTKTYITPNDLYQANVVQDGDIIEIDAADYSGQQALAVWFANDLVIRGVGGRPHLLADGEYIFGKGIWVLAGNNITVENIEFSGATVPSENGSGIRVDGFGFTIRHCYFHNNENGILSINTPNTGDILIEHSEFAYNGFGSGFTHNVYINSANSLTFRYNYSHHANIGHCLKSRADQNFIYHNRIMDEQTGISSRLIDISNGGFSIIMGNLLMQGPNATNNNLIGYGLEGLTNPSQELYVINNTFVNKRAASCIFLSIQNGTSIANVSNNIFAGTGTIVQGNTTSYLSNYINTSINQLNFVDEPNYDYKLTSNSPAKNIGTAIPEASTYSLTPIVSYDHPTSFVTRVISDGTIDVGAYEYGNNVIPTTPIKTDITVELGDIMLEDSNYGVILTAPNGNCYRLKVDNTGNLTTQSVDCN